MNTNSRTRRVRSRGAGGDEVYDTKRMERAGWQAGLPHYWSISFPPRKAKEPFPAVPSREMTPIVQGVKEIGKRDMAQLGGDFHQEEDGLSRDNARRRERLEQLEDVEYVAASPKTWTIGYICFLCALAIGDFVLGRTIFSALGASRSDTVALAAVVAIAMPSAAHFAGLYAKRGAWIPAGVACAAAAAVATVIAAVRTSYLEGTGVASALGMSMSSSTLSALFWALQAALFVVAVLAAYGHTVRDPEGERLARERETLARELADAEERLASLPSIYDSMADEVNATWRGLAMAYHEANVRARSRVDIEAPIWPQYLVDIPKPAFARRAASSPLPQPSVGASQQASTVHQVPAALRKAPAVW